jgi:uncharacterized membrane protein YkoI
MVGALNRKEHVMQVSKALVATAMVIGVAGGSYGLASAATGSGTTTATTPSTQAAAPSAQQPWGDQRSDETPLTGDALAKVTAVANAQVAGGTVVRVETDADGNAKYEAHMTKADGTPVTVYVDANYNFVSVQTR